MVQFVLEILFFSSRSGTKFLKRCIWDICSLFKRKLITKWSLLADIFLFLSGDWCMNAVACYICLVQMLTVTLLFGERLLLANEFFHWQDFTQRSPAKWEKMFPLISCRVIHDFKASNELITQPLYQSIVIRYVESCKHTLSRNFFCKSFVYNLFIWVKGTTTHINHTVTSSSVIFWKLSLFRYVLLWTKMVIIGGTHLKKIGKGENYKA